MKDDVTVRVPVLRLFPDGKRPAPKAKAPLEEPITGEVPRRRRSDEPTRKVSRR